MTTSRQTEYRWRNIITNLNNPGRRISYHYASDVMKRPDSTVYDQKTIMFLLGNDPYLSDYLPHVVMIEALLPIQVKTIFRMKRICQFMKQPNKWLIYIRIPYYDCHHAWLHDGVWYNVRSRYFYDYDSEGVHFRDGVMMFRRLRLLQKHGYTIYTVKDGDATYEKKVFDPNVKEFDGILIINEKEHKTSIM